jgi:deoxyribonuclease-4
MRFGTAGIPSCVSGDIARGVRGISDLGLSAIEIMLKEDVVIKAPLAFEAGKVARETGVKISVHVPYSVNLLGRGKIAEESQKKVLDAARLAGIMKASPVVLSVGNGRNTGKVIKALESIIRIMQDESIETKIGLETSAKSKEWGTLDEILGVCSVLDVVPVPNFANIYHRNKEELKSMKDYLSVFEKIMNVDPSLLFDIHIHFSNIEFKRGVGIKYVQIDKSPPFDPLAKVMIRMGIEPTLISGTPVPEVGAVKMKEIISGMRG